MNGWMNENKILFSLFKCSTVVINPVFIDSKKLSKFYDPSLPDKLPSIKWPFSPQLTLENLIVILTVKDIIWYCIVISL